MSNNRLYKTQNYELKLELNHYIPNSFTVFIDGTKYKILFESGNGPDELQYYMLNEYFKNNTKHIVRFSSGNYGGGMHGLFCLHVLPEFSALRADLTRSVPEVPKVSVGLFNPTYIYIRYASYSDTNSPNFGLGRFDYLRFLRVIEFDTLMYCGVEYLIPKLWNSFVSSLRQIGYFDIFDFNHINTVVLTVFLRMFIDKDDLRFVRNENQTRILFYSFIKQFLSKNYWFLIVGQSFKPISGRPSRELITIFSDKRGPPIVSFLDENCVGVITPDNKYALVSLSTLDLIFLKSCNYDDSQNFHLPPTELYLTILRSVFPPPPINDDDDDDDDDVPPLRRRPACIDMSSVPSGRRYLSLPEQSVYVLFKRRKCIDAFIQPRPKKTYEHFCPYYIILMNTFEIRSLSQLTAQFTEFQYMYYSTLIYELIDCKFEQIYDDQSSIEQIREFLCNSRFGIVIRHLMSVVDRISEQLQQTDAVESDDRSSKQLRQMCKFAKISKSPEFDIESIQKNHFICDFKRVFVFIVNKYSARHDLGPEIDEILIFLDSFVKFLTPS